MIAGRELDDPLQVRLHSLTQQQTHRLRESLTLFRLGGMAVLAASKIRPSQ